MPSSTIGATARFAGIEAVCGEQEITCKNFENKIDEITLDIPPPPKLELSDGILNVLKDTEDVVNNDFLKENDLNKKDIEDIKKQYNFEDIKRTLEEGYIPLVQEFFYGGDNEKFRINCDILGLNIDNSKLIDFICSERGELMQENILFIHVETGNIFYDNFNTNESFYDLLAQQDENKQIINKRISYPHTFQKNLQQFLQSFDFKEIDKYDLYSNKNANFLFYGFNSYLEPICQPTKIIFHSKKINNKFSLEKIQKIDCNIL